MRKEPGLVDQVRKHDPTPSCQRVLAAAEEERPLQSGLRWNRRSRPGGRPGALSEFLSMVGCARDATSAFASCGQAAAWALFKTGGGITCQHSGRPGG